MLLNGTTLPASLPSLGIAAVAAPSRASSTVHAPGAVSVKSGTAPAVALVVASAAVLAVAPVPAAATAAAAIGGGPVAGGPVAAGSVAAGSVAG